MKKSTTKTESIIRFLAGGTIISLIVILGKFFGGYVGGAFTAFPVMMLTTLAFIYSKHGGEGVTSFQKGYAPGLISSGTYILIVFYALPLYGLVLGTIISYLTSTAIAAVAYKTMI